MLFSLKTIFKPEDLKTEESIFLQDDLDWEEEEKFNNLLDDDDNSLNSKHSDSFQPDFKGGNLDELLRQIDEEEKLKAEKKR